MKCFEAQVMALIKGSLYLNFLNNGKRYGVYQTGLQCVIKREIRL